ncbi:hypothetical protein A4A49_65741, partial [Nicotiana attenuata]
MHRFEWVVDTFSIIEEESMLPLPTKLNMVCFADIEKQIPGDEFGKQTSLNTTSFFRKKIYTSSLSNLNSCIQLLYPHAFPKQTWWQLWQIDEKPFLFTIWGELADNDGTQILHQLHRYPVIGPPNNKVQFLNLNRPFVLAGSKVNEL